MHKPVYFNRKPVTSRHTYKHSLKLRPHWRPLRLHNYEPHTKAFGNYYKDSVDDS